MNTDISPESPSEPAKPAQPRSWREALPWGALALAALVVAIVGLLQDDEAVKDLRMQLATRLDESSRSQKELTTLLDKTRRELHDEQTRVSQLEGKLSEFQGQRIVLEEMYRELARAPDDWLLAEIEQTLNIASRELTLANNVRAALIALQGADQRLARADKLQVMPLRRAITQDIERLKALPQLDLQGISLKIDNMVTQIPTLTLAVADVQTTTAAQQANPANGDTWIQRIASDLAQEIRQLVRINRLENADNALLSPQQSYFLRENLKLRLLSARTALISRDETNFKEDLKIARDLLTRHFDSRNKAVGNMLTQLKQFSENPVSISTPDITVSLNAVRAARAARERPFR